jgi:DNA recombination protein RmuC
MRETVDEKLHATLEKRLGESFKIVSERLEQVHKGLGEMQTLAVGVGDLKKVLSNVKTRGILGEIQLGNILEQILTPDQYAKNVATKKGSRENVEYAIKLPGRDDSGEVVYLPLDSKFPLEHYHLLVDAYEHGDHAAIEKVTKLLENTIKKCAKDIRDKYLDPPNTTDFGIMFLPVEGLYAEVVRRPALFEVLQRDYKITIAGPTTLAAILNSLQMGFRTLAIEKRSSEVWMLLGAVKTEFGKFGAILERTHKQLQTASNTIEDAAKKSRTIERKLMNVQGLPSQEAVGLIGNIEDTEDEETANSF